MEKEIKDALASLDQSPEEFRDQVQRLRQFRDRMKEAGAIAESEQFSIPLMERLETIRKWTISGIQMD